MGDRAVFGFRSSSLEPTIYLYSHWGGTTQERDLADALEAARPRWSDPSYATRIALSRLVGPTWDVETGFGVYAGDGGAHGADYQTILVVDWEAGKVLVCLNDDSSVVLASYGLDEFVDDPSAAMTAVA